jgi:hypothetical protein
MAGIAPDEGAHPTPAGTAKATSPAGTAKATSSAATSDAEGGDHA